jgi:phenylalanyl-tRNA synthetase beta chain
MKILLSWLREYVDVPVEPRKLAEDLTLVGLELGGLETLGPGDAVLDLEITTNRVDCMNVYGVAREVSALYDSPLKPLDLSLPESGTPAADAWRIAVVAPDLCPRFCGRVIDVRVGPSPPWLRDRLEAVGQRSISNLVDLTNYVMLEMGQPSHAFDLDRVPGQSMQVRWAREGERLVTLDGQERALSPRIGVVAAAEGPPLALAGIMGGASSEVSEATRVIGLEAAYWEPLAIRRAAKSLGMHTEASHRFERGADPEATRVSLDRLAHLLVKIGAGTVRPGLIDVNVAPRPARRSVLRMTRVNGVLGTDVPVDRARAVLGRLGFGVEAKGEAWSVLIPTWRGDVSREADLVEEVGRHHGLDKIAPTVPPARGAEGLRPAQAAQRAVREILVGAGLTEVINYAFVPAGEHLPAGPALQNPLSEEQAVLRNSLVRPGLLGTLHANLRHGRQDVRVFELGRVFGEGTPLPDEQLRLAVLLSGSRGDGHWGASRNAIDFFDLKGVLDLLAARLGLEAFEWSAEEAPAFLHPGQAAVVRRNGRVLGHAGAIHPRMQGVWELKEPVFVAEIELADLLEAARPPVRARPLPRFPAVDRDLSVVAQDSTSVDQIARVIRASGGPSLRELHVVDRYAGPPIPRDHASLTFALVYQDPTRTLTGEEVQASVDAITRALAARGLTIRGE